MLEVLGASIAALGVVGGAFVSLIGIFGGHVPPWATDDAIQKMIDAAVAPLRAEADYKQCSDYNDRFVRAQKALQRNQSDMVAIDLFKASSDKIATIPNCKPEILPPMPAVMIAP